MSLRHAGDRASLAPCGSRTGCEGFLQKWSGGGQFLRGTTADEQQPHLGEAGDEIAPEFGSRIRVEFPPPWRAPENVAWLPVGLSDEGCTDPGLEARIIVPHHRNLHRTEPIACHRVGGRACGRLEIFGPK